MFYSHDMGWGSGWEVLMIIAMPALWALVFYGIVWLVRNGTRTGHPAGPPVAQRDTPIEILERRLANGELTVLEYRERREALEHRDDSSP